MTKPAHPRDGYSGDAARASRLRRLAAFVSQLRNPSREPARAMAGEGTNAAPYRFGGSPTADLEAEFSQMAYDAGWVIPDFDWMSWIGTDEGMRLVQKPQALADASEDDLARLLTALVRQDRFADGTLRDALARGLLLAAAERAEALQSVSDNSKDLRRS